MLQTPSKTTQTLLSSRIPRDNEHERPRSVNPQGLMRENHSRSVVTFSANPCMVI